jgi:hypothetical protein
VDLVCIAAVFHISNFPAFLFPEFIEHFSCIQNVTPFSIVGEYERLGGKYSLRCQGRIEKGKGAVRFYRQIAENVVTLVYGRTDRREETEPDPAKLGHPPGKMNFVTA